VPHHRLQHLTKEQRSLINIRQHATDQLAGLGALVERETQFLEMSE
jgi:hypothetical protein